MTDSVPAMSLDNFTVSLRVRHPSIDPQEITRTLAFEPQHTWRAGEPRHGARGRPLGGTYHESYWQGELRELDAGLRGAVDTEVVLMQAVVRLRRLQPFLSRLQSEGATIELFVELAGASEYTCALSPQLLTLLARAGICLVLKVSPQTRSAERRKAG